MSDNTKVSINNYDADFIFKTLNKNLCVCFISVATEIKSLCSFRYLPALYAVSSRQQDTVKRERR